jgi:uncharacterized membrane protein
MLSVLMTITAGITFAQMSTGQGGGMMGGGWGMGFGFGWVFIIIIVVLVILGVVYMMKRR